MYLISACLVGINCRYDGGNTTHEGLVKLIEEGKAIAVCPEVLGNLPIPRDPCEIIKTNSGVFKVMSLLGEDRTKAFIEGASKALEICKVTGIDVAILKSKSPSCGYGQIYDGTFTRNLIKGNGVTAEWLSKNGIQILNEENWQTMIQ